MKTIRCSSLPRLVACAAAGQPPATNVEPPRDAADLGSAVHEALAALIKTSSADYAEIAAKFDVEADDMAPLVGWAWGRWQETLRPLYPNPLIEEALRVEDAEAGIVLTGHPDVLAFDGVEVRGLDHKTGWLSIDARPQLKGYAVQGLCRWPEAQRARMSVLRIRERVIDTYVWSREEVFAWWGWLAAHLNGEQQYRPGVHCGFCPRALECPAHQQVLQSAVAVLGVVSPDALEAEDLGLAVLNARLLEKRLQQFIEQARAEVQARGGEWGPLRVVEQQKRTIDYARAEVALTSALGHDKLTSLLKVSKTEVEKAVKETAARGQKGAVVKALMDRLEGIGALTLTTTPRLEVTYGPASSQPPSLAGAVNDGAAGSAD